MNQKAQRRSRLIPILVAANFVFTVVLSYLNLGDVRFSLSSGLTFAALITVVVIALHIGAGMAERKGYDTWIGVLAVLLLNVVGYLLLAVLPTRSSALGTN